MLLVWSGYGVVAIRESPVAGSASPYSREVLQLDIRRLAAGVGDRGNGSARECEGGLGRMGISGNRGESGSIILLLPA